MKLVREYIEQFTRGKNPFKSLNIGKRAQIENWFETWAPYNEYEINDDLNIKVKGFLWLAFPVTSLPDNLHIGSHLDICKSKITSLPENLYVNGALNISKTNITSLPNNLHVGTNLYMGETKITSLPDNLYVGGEIYKDF